MRAFLGRWRRVAARLVLLGTQARGIVMKLLGLLAAWVGAGVFSTAIFGWGRVLRWLVADDWTHVGFVVAVSLFLLALIALYQREKEDDEQELKGVSVKAENGIAEVLQEYPYSRDNVFEDVLEVKIRLVFQNNSAADVHPRVSGVDLQYKPHRTWKVLSYALGPGCSPYMLDVFHVPPRAIERESFEFHARLPGGTSSYARQSMRLILRLAVPGQRNCRLVHHFTLPEPATS